LIHKDIEHEVEFIELNNPPTWFQDVSPLRKVPALVVGDVAFFGSTVINEYLDEQYPNRLHPKEALQKAVSRSWIEFGGECISDIGGMMLNRSEADASAARDALLGKFDRLENIVGAGPLFNGKQFSLVDAAYAPAFQRLDYLDAVWPGCWSSRRHPNIAGWKDRLLAHPSVLSSTVPGLQELFYEFVRRREGYVARFL
jgi:glutathione S-transferase